MESTPNTRECSDEEIRLAAIVESSNDAIIGKTLDGIITSWNSGAEGIYGYTKEEAIGRHISMLVPPNMPDEIPQILEHVRRGERVDHYRTIRVTKAGRWIYVSLTVSPIRDSTGNIVGASAIAHDITELRIAEEALAESERQFRAIFDSSLDPLIIFDDDGVCLDANPEACELLERTKDQLVGTNLREYAAPDVDLSGLMQEFVTAGKVEGDISINTADGTIKDVEFRAVRNVIPGRHLSSLRDITERKRWETALRESEDKFSKMFQSSPAIVTLSSIENGIYADVNASFTELLGYSREEVIGHSAIELPIWLNPDDRKQVINQIRAGKTVRNFEAVFRRKDGSPFYGLISAEAVEIGGKDYLLAISNDITEGKLAHEALDRSIRAVATILESITDAFISMDDNWNLTYMNGEAERLMHRKREEVMGESVWNLFPGKPGTPFYDKCLEVAASHVSSVLELFYEPLNLWVELHIYPSEDGISVYFQDISERKEAEKVLHERYERERTIAETLQRSLLPPVDLSVEGFRIVEHYQAAWSEAEVGGDFYDVFELSDGRIALVTGDVSGKGLRAAVHTAMSKYAIRAYAHESAEPRYVMERLNDVLYTYLPEDAFVTVFYGVLDPSTRTVTYSSSGHDEPVLYSPSTGQISYLSPTGSVAGIAAGGRYGQKSVVLDPGDVLVIYTDGITDSRSEGRFFGLEGLTQTIMAKAHLDERELATAIFNASEDAGGGVMRDDAAVLIVKSNDGQIPSFYQI